MSSQSSLDAFIAGLRARHQPPAGGAATPLPGVEETATIVRQVAADDAREALVQRFTAAAQRAGVEVHPVNADRLAEEAASIVAKLNLRSALLVPDGEGMLTAELASKVEPLLRAVGIETITTFDDETMFRVDAGVTGVQAAIAETGTLVCLSSADSPRGASLIPPIHVAVVSSRQILADLADLFPQLLTGGAANNTGAAQPALPACVNLISAPSKTADIEGILIKGVHGPREVHVLLVD